MARSKKYYKRKYKKYYRKKYYYSKRTSPRTSWKFANAVAGGYSLVRFRSSVAIPMSTNADGYSFTSYIHPLIYNSKHKTVAGEVLPVSVFDDVPSMKWFNLYDQFKIKGVKVKLSFPAPVATGKTAHLCYDWVRSANYGEFRQWTSQEQGLIPVNKLFLANSAAQIPISSSAKNTITLKCYAKGMEERSNWLSTDLNDYNDTIFGNISTKIFTADDFYVNKWDKPCFFWPLLKFGITNDYGGVLTTYAMCQLTTYIEFKDYSPKRAGIFKELPTPPEQVLPMSQTQTRFVREQLDMEDAAAEAEPDDTLPLELDPDYQEALRKERMELASKKAKDKLLLERKLKRTE